MALNVPAGEPSTHQKSGMANLNMITASRLPAAARAFAVQATKSARQRLPRLRRCPLSSLLGRQSGFRETLGNPPDVFFPLEWLPGEMFAKGVFWIDLSKFTPNATGLIDLTEMARSGCKHGACKICLGNEENPLP
jgi:hypothetical protein